MSATIEFIFDFGSPNAYLAYRALPPILARTGASLAISPCLLGGIFKATGNLAPTVAFAPIKGKLEYEMLELRRFVEVFARRAVRVDDPFGQQVRHRIPALRYIRREDVIECAILSN